MMNIEQFGVSDVGAMGGKSKTEQRYLEEMLDNATRYMQKFPWCAGVEAAYFGAGAGKIFAVFLFEVKMKWEASNRLFWVVVGDIPPAYLVADEETGTPLDALDLYCCLMGAWVEAVEKQEPVDDLIPVNVPPTAENAAMLASRLDYLGEHFLRDE